MDLERLYSIFKAISPLTDEDWQLLEPQLYVKKFRKGDFYLRADDTESQMGFIIQGSFRWYFVNPKGEEVNFHFFFENSFVVEYMGFLTLKPSQMHIEAMEDSTLVMLPKRHKILELYEVSRNWERFGRIMAETTYIATAGRVQDFLFHSAEERYITLLSLHPDIFQRVSLANISSYLGIKGPSLSRIRRRLSKG